MRGQRPAAGAARMSPQPATRLLGRGDTVMRHRPLSDGRGSSRRRLLAVSVLALFAVPAGAAEPPAPAPAFLKEHCTTCHNAEEKRGRLDLARLAFDAKDPANLAVWVKVHDRVKAGEMPPKS